MTIEEMKKTLQRAMDGCEQNFKWTLSLLQENIITAQKRFEVEFDMLTANHAVVELRNQLIETASDLQRIRFQYNAYKETLELLEKITDTKENEK